MRLLSWLLWILIQLCLDLAEVLAIIWAALVPLTTALVLRLLCSMLPLGLLASMLCLELLRTKLRL